jgi:hypothetical protein
MDAFQMMHIDSSNAVPRKCLKVNCAGIEKNADSQFLIDFEDYVL